MNRAILRSLQFTALLWVGAAACRIGWAAEAPSAGATPAAPAAKVPEGAGAGTEADDQRLQSSDKLYYRVAQDPSKLVEPELLVVNALGELHCPISRGSGTTVAVVARGRALGEVRLELKRKLDADYYYDATVMLRLHERSQKAGQALIYGRGVRGGAITLPPGERKTLLEAILQAGPTDFANLRKVRLHRVEEGTDKTRSETIDVEALKRSGDRSKDVVLQDGDRIEVPEKGIVF